MARSASIAVIEPQMHNLFHAPFNAALLHAIVLGFPDAKVSFSALPGHASVVRSILEQHAPALLTGVEWRGLETPRGRSVLARWWCNRRIFRGALARRERVVFCSISRMQLLQLNRMMAPDDEVLAVLHGDLERIAEPKTGGFPANLFSLESVLLTEQPRGLRFVLLGESIRKNIPVKFSKVFADAAVIDHPYHFRAVESQDVMPTAGEMVFGIFGNSGDGRLLEEIARRVKAANAHIIFRLIGFVSDAESIGRLLPLVEGVGSEPISREEFVRRAESVSYALWLAPADSFRLRASGTFFDALAYRKPLVYVANAFLDSYLAPGTDFAVRCEQTQDVVPAILRVAERHNAAEYSVAQATMLAFRARFAPEALAASLPSKFGW